MPRRDRYDHGVPSWVDVSTTDLEETKAFYAAVFGWEAEDMFDGDDVVYTTFALGGRTVAGAGAHPPELAGEGIPPVWSTYVNVDDADAVVARVVESGGGVAMPAADIYESGRMAFVTDPSGASIGLWQPRDHVGAGLVNEHGALVWNELITDDVAAAKAFYSSVFGWDPRTAEMPGGFEYTTFTLGERGMAGLMEKNPRMGPIPNAWGVYFGVDDIEACAAAVAGAGGAVSREPFDTPMGRMAVLRDPVGATFMAIEMNEEARSRA